MPGGGGAEKAVGGIKVKILTKNAQKMIEKNRDTIYKYMRNSDCGDVKEFEAAVEALADISFECGVWNNPADFGRGEYDR